MPKHLFKLLIYLIIANVGVQELSGQSCNVDGGVITTDDNTILCVGDQTDDIITFDLRENMGSRSIWLLTDENQNILSRLQGQPLNFNAANDGVILVYHMSYEEDATGFLVGSNLDNIQGCHDLSNPISIVKNLVEGGRIYDNNNSTTRAICLSDSDEMQINLILEDEFGDNSSWVITDENQNILDTPASQPIDLSGSLPETCFIYHIGHNEITGLQIGNNLSDLEGCFAFSNPYQVMRLTGSPVAGRISTSSSTSICSGDEFPDLIDISISGNNTGVNTFVVTDPNGSILNLENNTTIELNALNSDLIYIHNVQYIEGTQGLTIGGNINEIQGCHDLSNAISISANRVQGGTLREAITNESELHFCTDDGNSDMISLSLEDNIGTNSQLLIVNEEDTIIQLPGTTSFDFEGFESGLTKIYNASYNADLTGLTIGNVLSDLNGCFDLSNPLIINKYTGETNAGIISTNDETIFCSGDADQDIINVTVNNHANNEGIFVVTNEEQIITMVSPSATFDFSNAGSGTSNIYYIDFIDNLANLRVGNSLSELEGCHDISNAIPVIRSGVEGGNLEFSDNTLTTNLCISSSTATQLSVNLTGTEGNQQFYLLTSSDNIILDTLSTLSIDFSEYNRESYRLYNLSSLANLSGLQIGNNITLLDGCFDLSNPVSINIQETMTTPSDISTSSPTNVCVGDGNPDIIDVDIVPGVGQTRSYVVTDPDGDILRVSEADRIDFENIPGVTNFIVVINHDPDIVGLEVGGNIMSLEGCHSTSNQIRVDKNINSGGTLSFANSDASMHVICEGYPETSFSLRVEGNSGQNSIFVTTNPSGNIIGVHNNPDIDFADRSPGNYLVWHISYDTGAQGITVGQNVNAIIGCHALSAPLEVLVEEIDGGNIVTTTEMTEVDICAGEGINDLVEVFLTDVEGVNRTWVLTSPAGNIISLPSGPVFTFEEMPTGVYYLYNLTMGSDFQGLEIGQNINGFSGCYDLSNRITVRNRLAAGGNLSMEGQGDFYEACVSDDGPDFIDLQLSDVSGASQTYLMTETNGRILDIFNTSTLDVNKLSGGVCRVYNIAHYGIVDGLEIGGSIDNLSGCFNLSNFVTIRKNEPSGGLLSDINGADRINVCLGDDIDEMINVRLSGLSGPNQTWVVTEKSGEIITSALNPPFRLEQIGGTELNVYSLAYEDGLAGLSGGRNIQDLQGCYSLSNPLVITKDVVQAANLLSTENGLTETTMCMDDSIPNLLIMQAEGEIIGDNTHLIVVGPDGIIEDDMEVGNIDFTDAADGQSLIYQISYANGLMGLDEGALLEEISGCYDISNALTLNRVSGSECLVNTLEINGKTIEFELNPNPANDYIYLHQEGNATNLRGNLEIFDQMGKRIMQQNNVVLDHNNHAMDISRLPAGLYYLKISVGRNLTAMKFIKN